MQWIIRILWHIDPLQGNDRETNDIRAVAMQQLRKYATVLEPLLGSGPLTTMEVRWKRYFLCGPLQSCITQPNEFSSVELV
jgi:hypothetical protein